MDLEWQMSSIGDDAGTMLAVDGELNLATCERLLPAASAAVAARRPLVLDLSNCPFIDSTGLNLILQISMDLAGADGPPTPIAIVIGGSAMRQRFSISGIDRLIPLFDTRDQATEWIGTGPSPGESAPMLDTWQRFLLGRLPGAKR